MEIHWLTRAIIKTFRGGKKDACLCMKFSTDRSMRPQFSVGKRFYTELDGDNCCVKPRSHQLTIGTDFRLAKMQMGFTRTACIQSLPILVWCERTLKVHPHQNKVEANWLPINFRLASDSKIGVMGPCTTNSTEFYFNQMWSQSLPLLFWCERTLRKHNKVTEYRWSM